MTCCCPGLKEEKPKYDRKCCSNIALCWAKIGKRRCPNFAYVLSLDSVELWKRRLDGLILIRRTARHGLAFGAVQTSRIPVAASTWIRVGPEADDVIVARIAIAPQEVLE